MSRRLDALRAEMAEARLDGLLVTGIADVRYLSGFTGSAGFLLLEPGVATLFTDFRYQEQAAGEIDADVSLRVMKTRSWSDLAEHLRASPAGRRLGFDAARLSVAELERIARVCDSVIWEPTEGPVERLRARKDEAELEAIAAAVDLADLVLEGLIDDIHRGISEMELAALLEYRLRSAGSGPLPFAPIVAFGERSALPHATPSDRRLERGDLVLLDFGARIDGYCSDMTRVFVSGPASDRQRTLHDSVLEACRAAIELITAGVPAAEVDAAARDALAQDGLAEYFGHSTGHGLGLEIHEAPRLHREEADALTAGNVVTVEPGVYLPGEGGIRIEQAVAVETGRGRLLTRSSPELIEL